MPTSNNNKLLKKPFNQWVFNQMISDEREENGFTQEEMGRLLGVTGKTICAYEQKKILPSLQTLILFMKAFNKKIVVVDKFEEIQELEIKN